MLLNGLSPAILNGPQSIVLHKNQELYRRLA